MRNVYLIDEHVSSRTNGIGPFIKAYTACLKKMGVNLSIVSFNEDVAEFDIKMEKGVRKLLFPIFPTGNFLNHPQIVNRFFKQYIKDSADNVFCFNHSPCRDLLQTIKDSFPLSKIVFTIHDMAWTGALKGESAMLAHIVAHRKRKAYREKYGNLLDYFDQEKQMYDFVDAIVCLSHNTYDVLRDVYRIDENKINLIPSGMRGTKIVTSEDEKMQIRKKWNIGKDEKILFYAGRLSGPKGIYPLVAAFTEVLKSYPDTRLVLAGSANSEWSYFLASIKRISSKIITTGFISKKELKEWYRIVDIGIIPSYYEQCPYVAIEMMMYGLPIVVSDANGLRDMFTDKENAVVVPLGDRQNSKEFTGHIRDALMLLLESEQLRRELGKKAKQTYRNTYSLTAMCERYQRFFNNIN